MAERFALETGKAWVDEPGKDILSRLGDGGYKMNETPAFIVSAENVFELGSTCKSLFKCLHWLAERKDLEAVEMLIPEVEKVSHLLMDIIDSGDRTPTASMRSPEDLITEVQREAKERKGERLGLVVTLLSGHPFDEYRVVWHDATDPVGELSQWMGAGWTPAGYIS